MVLSDDLVDGRGAHPHRQRRAVVGVGQRPARHCGQGHLTEQVLAHLRQPTTRDRPPTRTGSLSSAAWAETLRPLWDPVMNRDLDIVLS